MPNGGAEFVLSLLDRTSGPATVAEKKLKLLEARMKGLDKLEKGAKTDKARDQIRFMRMGLEIQKDTLAAAMKTKSETESWMTKLDHSLGVVQKVGGAAWSVAKGIGEVVIGVTKFGIETSAAKEQQILMFKGLLGTRDAAEQMVATLDKLSYKTAFTDDELGGWGRKFLSGGFDASVIPSMLRMTMDAASAVGATEGDIDGAVESFNRLAMEGKLGTRQLMAMQRIGIDVGAVFRHLGGDLGITAEKAKALAAKGGIGTGSIFDAMMGAVAETRSGGKLGAGSEAMANESTKVMLSKVKERWSDFFEDLHRGRGFKTFNGFLRNISNAFDGSTRSGQRMADAISGAFDSVFSGAFGRLTGPEGLVVLEGLILRVANGIQLAGAALTGAARGFGAGFLEVMKPLIGETDELFDGPLSEDKLSRVTASFERMGTTIGKVTGGIIRFLNSVSDFTGSLDFFLTGDTDGDKYQYSDTEVGRGLAAAHRIMARNKANSDGSATGTANLVGQGLMGPLQGAWDLADIGSAMLFGDSPNIPSPQAPEGGFSSGESIVINNNTQVDARGATSEAASSIAETSSAANEKSLAASMSRAAMSRGAR